MDIKDLKLNIDSRLGYTSPIQLLVGQMQLRQEESIVKAVQNVGVNVDKEELIKALQYDREQYQKGYKDRDKEIVRCKDCTKCDLPEEEPYENGYCSRCGYVKMDWFCADGKRRTG